MVWPNFSEVFEVEPIAPLTRLSDDDEKKKAFGIELGKGHTNAFVAALEVFPDPQKAMWALSHWLNDPIVIANRDLYLKTSAQAASLLDRNALAAKVLQFVDEKHIETGRYVIDAKERLAGLKLFAEIQGFIGKTEVNNSSNTFVNNSMTVKFVKPDDKALKVIDSNSNTKPELNKVLNPLPIKIKLVGANG